MKSNIFSIFKSRWLIVVLLLLTLNGCTDVEKREYQPILHDSLNRFDTMPDGVEKRTIMEQAVRSGIPLKSDVTNYKPHPESLVRYNRFKHLDETPVWLPPRLVTSGDPTAQQLPASVLLKVEIVLYPKIDCNADSRQIGVSYPSRAYLAPVSTEEIAALGEPTKITKIWMIPATTEDRVVELGPAWLGSALQLAGKGRRVLFDASQNCQVDAEYAPIQLPVAAFSNALEPPYLVDISQKQPFVAKVIEVCSPPDITVKHYRRTEDNWFYAREFVTERFQATLTADCPTSGLQTFSIASREGFPK